MHVGKIATSRKTTLLQHEMTNVIGIGDVYNKMKVTENAQLV